MCFVAYSLQRMQSDLYHFSSKFTAIQCITLKVVYAACERVLNVKTGWAISSRRMWHFCEDAALKMHNNITKRIISFRVVSNNLLSTPMGIDYVVIGFNMEVQPLVIHSAASPLCVSDICIDIVSNHLLFAHMTRALLA